MSKAKKTKGAANPGPSNAGASVDLGDSNGPLAPGNKGSREGLAGADAPRERRWGRWRALLLLLLVPLALLGPVVFSDELFLPWLPAGLEPLAGEDRSAARAAFENANFPQGDRVFPVLTDQIAMSEELAEGALPTWEPLFGMGAPLFAGSIAAAAYPPNWLAFLVAPERAAGALALLSLFLAGLGAWLFLRGTGLGPGPAVVGVLALQLGHWGVGNLYYYMKVDAALWLPWSLWAVDGCLAGRRWSGLALTLSIGLSLLAGFVTVALFGVAFVGCYGVWRALQRELAQNARPDGSASTRVQVRPSAVVGSVARVASFAALGLLLASVQLLPSFEASRQSLRTDRTVDNLVGEALPAATLLGTAIPDLFGSPTEPTPVGRLPVAWWLTPKDQWTKAETANQLEWNSFAGLAVVLLALVAVVATPRRAALPAIGLFLVLGFAQAWPLVRWAYALPGLNIGAPARVLGVGWLLWPWLAALGVQALLERRPRAQATLFAASFLVAAAAFLLWSEFEPSVWVQQLEATLLERYEDPAEIRARITPDSALTAGLRLEDSLGRTFGAALGLFTAAAVGAILTRPRNRFSGKAPLWSLVLGLFLIWALASAPAAERVFSERFGLAPAWVALGSLAALGLCALLPARRRTDLGLWVPLAAAVLIEGIFAADGHVTTRAAENGLFPTSQSIEAVATAAQGGRVLRLDTSSSGAEHVANLARPNMLEPYGVADLTGYIVFTPRTLNELFTALDPRTRFRSGISRVPAPELLDHPILDLVGAACILALEPVEHPRLELIFARPGFHVYRRSGALPLVRVVPELVQNPDDETVLRRLAAGEVDFARETLLAPEEDIEAARELASGPAAANEGPGGGLFRPGQVEAVERSSRSRLRIELWGSSGGWLVLHEQFYPGWKAWVNGQPRDILRTDHVCRAVPVPRGDSVIEFAYEPRSLTMGLWASAAALLGAVVLSWRWRGRA